MKQVKVNERGRPVGDAHHFARMTDAEVDLVHELLDAGLSYSAIAAKMDVSKSCVAHIAKGRRRCQTAVDIRVVPDTPRKRQCSVRAVNEKQPTLPPVLVNESALLLQRTLASDWR